MMIPEPDDYTLAHRARDGDRHALEALVERLRLSLFAVAYAHLHHYEDAQDAVASALLRICLHIDSLREPGRMRAWIQAILRNETRRIRRERLPAANVDTEEADSSPAQADAALLRLDIRRALRRLPTDQARAVALFYLAGLPIREIAQRTGRPEGTIKSWLHEGRRRLALEMEGYRPMTPQEETASIISTDLAPDVLQSLADALRAAGYTKVNLISDYASVARLEETGEGENREFHLPAPLKGTNFVILDEWIGGRSAFELYPILKTAVEKKEMPVCLFLNATDEAATRAAVFSAWVSGFDLLLTKPVNPAEFQRFAERIRRGEG